MQGTRHSILEFLLRHDEGTVGDLSKALGLSATGVRQHLVILQRDGLISSAQQRGGVGRPRHGYSLTDSGRAMFPTGYDRLGSLLISQMELSHGPFSPVRLFKEAADRLAGEFKSQVDGETLEERVQQLADMYHQQGIVVEWGRNDDGLWMKEYGCPYFLVAREHQHLCVIEWRLLWHLMDARLKVVACQAHGSNFCQFRFSPKPAAKT